MFIKTTLLEQDYLFYYCVYIFVSSCSFLACFASLPLLGTAEWNTIIFHHKQTAKLCR